LKSLDIEAKTTMAKILLLLAACALSSANAGNVSTVVVAAPTDATPAKNLRSISSAIKEAEAADPSIQEAVSAAKADPTMADMEAAITDLMAGKNAFGATPMGGSVKTILNILDKTMKPKIVAAHRGDQRALNNAAKALKTCGSTKSSNMRKANKEGAGYRRNSGSHKRCRNSEAVKLASKNKCLAQQRSLHRIKKLRCNAFAQGGRRYGETKANRAIVNKAGSEKTEGYIVRISATICGSHAHGQNGKRSAKGGLGGGLRNGMLDKYLKLKEACRKATVLYNRKVKECRVKSHAYNVKKSRCNQWQTRMDAASCKTAVMVKDTCETYVGCYNLRKSAYERLARQVRGDETDRKAEWRGLSRMLCLMKAFADGKVTDGEVNSCKKQTHSTKHLNIKYPKLRKLARCALPTLYPATGAYKRKEFKPLPSMAKGKVSAECQGISSISTTPRYGSPKGAKGQRIALNGIYSAGGIVKITNGLDVRRSMDKNSCPRGTKIFSPASRSDWRTFLASAGPLRAPHWIIDVTRHANGCGGCTSNVMNSRNRNQKSWRTSDGSPWWLRNSRYTEPNGDYHANCYMDLWHKPQNENLVTFNDGNCNYHSKSYYCQPIKFDLTPAKGSPRSCKCTKIELTGSYSAGALVKCEQCKDVSRSRQKNSCPSGMKLFAPATRKDWKVFIDSAGSSLRAPHFIVDITRSQNSCGGCTRYPMKSTTPQQATWKTSDGAAWWLRSTTYRA